MKATILLRKDHEKLHDLFEKFLKPSRAGQNGKQQIFEEIRRELSLHANIENEVFYTALRDSSTHKETVDLVESLWADHVRIDTLLQDIASSKGNETLLESKVASLSELVQAHVEKEEEQLFSEARRVLSEQRLEELGLEMEQRRYLFTRAVA